MGRGKRRTVIEAGVALDRLRAVPLQSHPHEVWGCAHLPFIKFSLACGCAYCAHYSPQPGRAAQVWVSPCHTSQPQAAKMDCFYCVQALGMSTEARRSRGGAVESKD